MALPSFVDLHKKQEDEGDAWLLSYSDMVTLLFAFFAVLLSLSTLDKVKLEMLTQYFAKSDRITMKQLAEMVQESINAENLQQQVNVKLTSKGVEISFKDKLLFDLGKADLRDAAFPVLSKISGLLNYKEIAERKISIEGHTDSLPIRSAMYPSNWELSSARAASVVKFFTNNGLNSRRFESIGYADTQPIKLETDQSSGQPENRRVVVVITPDSYLVKAERKEIESSTPSPPLSKPQVSVITDQKPATKPVEKPAVPASTIQDDKKELMKKYFMLGQDAFKKGNYKQAIENWQKVLELNPEHQQSKTNIERAKKLLSQSQSSRPVKAAKSKKKKN
ncbi:MAG: OmpA family protein [Elusimicrobiota bacterium]